MADLPKPSDLLKKGLPKPQDLLEKKNPIQNGSGIGTQTSFSGSKPFQTQVDTKIPSVLTEQGKVGYEQEIQKKAQQKQKLSEQLKSAKDVYYQAQGDASSFSLYDGYQSSIKNIDDEISKNYPDEATVSRTVSGQESFQKYKAKRDQLISDREILSQESKNALRYINPKIESDINLDFEKNGLDKFTRDVDGFKVADEYKIDDYAKQYAEKSGLSDDGTFKKLVYDKLKSSVSFKISEPEIKKEFDKLYKSKTGVTPDEAIEKDFLNNFIEGKKIQSNLILQVESLNKEIKTKINDSAKSLSIEYKPILESINTNYKVETDEIKSKIEQLNQSYKSGLISRQDYELAFTNTKAQFDLADEQYRQLFDAESKKYLNNQNELFSKYNKRFNRQVSEFKSMADQQLSDASSKYGKSYKMSPEVKNQYESLWGQATKNYLSKEEAVKYELDRSSLMGNIGGQFAKNLFMGIGGGIKSISSMYDFDAGYVLGDYLENSFTSSSPEIKSGWDLLDPIKLQTSTGKMIGGMAPILGASALTAAATKSAPTALRLLTTGLGNYLIETAQIGGGVKDQVFQNTGNIADANKAAKKVMDANLYLLPLYALDGLPFLGNVTLGIGNTFARAGAKAALEVVTELPQEYFQGIFEDLAVADKPISDTFKTMTLDKFENTALNVIPTSVLLGGGGTAIQGVRENISKMQGRSLAAKVDLSNLTETTKKQFIYDTVLRRGDVFSKAYVSSLFNSGNINEQEMESFSKMIDDSANIMTESKKIGLNKAQSKVYAALRFDYLQSKNEFDSEQDEVSKKVYKAKMDSAEKSLNTYLSGGKPDAVLLTLPNNEQYIYSFETLNSIINEGGEILNQIISGEVSIGLLSDKSNPKAKELSDKLTKLKQDAVQVKTAGQVPVQPEATIGEEVEQGKPKSEAEVVTEEGVKAEEVGSNVGEDLKITGDVGIDKSNIPLDKTSQPVNLGSILATNGDKLDISAEEINLSYPGKKKYVRKITATKGDEKAIISFWENNNKLIILHVESTKKGAGYGTDLINKVIKEAKDAGIEEIVADNVESLSSEKYWEKQGFIQDPNSRSNRILPLSTAQEQTPGKQVEQLRAEEQAELKAAIPNAEQYLTDGKVDKAKLTDTKDKKAFKKIYDKYDKLITPLLPKKEAKVEEAATYSGVNKLFKSNFELSNIGTPEQYSKYLGTIFPESKVKGIVYHGSKTKKPTQIFVETFIGKNNKILGAGNGFYFTSDINYSKVYGETTLSIIDIKNPIDFNSDNYDSLEDLKKAARELSNKGDGVIDSRENNYYPQGEEKLKLSSSPDYIVFKPSQIHILGSNQDIEGFKNFVSKKEAKADAVITPDNSSNYANMTEDDKGNFVFLHVGKKGYKKIKKSSGATTATSKEEASALSKVGGVAMYYTSPSDSETMVTGEGKYAVAVPKEKVYDFNTDKLNFIEEAKARHESENPGKAFDLNSQLAYVTKIAGENGFDMVVAQWDGKTRAQTTKEFIPSDIQESEGNVVKKKFTEDYESNKKKGFEPVIPVSKSKKLADLYNKINEIRNKEKKYDDLYSLYADSSKLQQEDITKLIEESNLPQEIKDEYKDIIESKEESRRSKNIAGKKVKVKNAPEGNHLNIGLNEGRTKKKMSIDDVLSKLPKDVKVISYSEIDVASGEPTLVIETDRPLTALEIIKLLDDTKQQAIPQLSNGEGVLYDTERGTENGWGEFDPNLFILQDGKSLSQYTKTKVPKLNESNVENAIELLDDIRDNKRKAERASSRKKADLEQKITEAETELDKIPDETKIVRVINDNFDKIKKDLKEQGLLNVKC